MIEALIMSLEIVTYLVSLPLISDWLRAEEFRVRIRLETEVLNYPYSARPALGPNAYRGPFFGVKWAVLGVDQLSAPYIEVKNECSCIFNSPLCLHYLFREDLYVCL
jgi:hypothetical protein